MMYQIRACFMALSRFAHAENVDGKVGKFALGQRDGRHRVLGQHDMRHDGAGGLSLLVGNLIEARNVGIGLLLLVVDQMAVRAKLLRQLLAVKGIRLVGRRSGGRQSCSEKERDANHGNDTQIHGNPRAIASQSAAYTAPYIYMYVEIPGSAWLN